MQETTAISPYDIHILYYSYSNTFQIAYAYIHTSILCPKQTFSLYAQYAVVQVLSTSLIHFN